jgi:apolipoprotein N-acyltransferase
MNSNSQQAKIYAWILSIVSGILLGFSYPPSPLYSLAYVAFIPFLVVFTHETSYLKFFGKTYLFLSVLHIITLYWTGGFVVGKDMWMMIAGAAVLIVHPFFFLPSIMTSFWIKKKMGLIYGLVAFALFWISFEYWHSMGEYSFPWITIGNSQAYDLYRIQMIEYTSIYGISIILLAFNILAFVTLWNFSTGRWSFKSKYFRLTIGVLLALYLLPLMYGKIRMNTFDKEEKDGISVGVVQLNFDPWEKWGSSYSDKLVSYTDQVKGHLKETGSILKSKVDLVIWPETAIPIHILLPRFHALLQDVTGSVDTLGVPIFTGLPTAEYFDSAKAPVTATQIGHSNLFVESYNSTILFQPHQLGPIHNKSILVPFAERIPYAEMFRFLIEPLKWNVGISSWGKGNDTLVYSFPVKDGLNVKFSGMICYESAYPNYVRNFVKKGAEFLTIITNDSWWGNTSGAYQHAAFASLRAVETRRWIVQCANGGISLFVDPTGRRVQETKLYSQANLVGQIKPRTDKTFYVLHGDIVGFACLTISLLYLIAILLARKRS